MFELFLEHGELLRKFYICSEKLDVFYQSYTLNEPVATILMMVYVPVVFEFNSLFDFTVKLRTNDGSR